MTDQSTNRSERDDFEARTAQAMKDDIDYWGHHVGFTCDHRGDRRRAKVHDWVERLKKEYPGEYVHDSETCKECERERELLKELRAGR
jgi:hypothetical protein